MNGERLCFGDWKNYVSVAEKIYVSQGQELSMRVKRLLARKTNLQRKRRTKLPKNLR